MALDLPDTRGLICGFQLRADGPATPLDVAVLDGAATAAPSGLWLHFNLTDTRARHWIAQCPWLPARARELLLSADPQARVERVDDGFVGSLASLHLDDGSEFGLFHFHVDARCVITGRRHPLAPLESLRAELSNGAVIDGPARMLLRLIDVATATLAATTAALDDTIDAAEDRILVGRLDRQGIDLGDSRRYMARLRRLLVAERAVMQVMAEDLPAWWGEAATDGLGRSIDTVTAVAQDLELVQERARLLSEEVSHRLAEATNRNLYFLSIITAVFMPISLVAGIFGMNVGGLPWLETPWGFLWTILCMAATLALALWFLRRRRML
jgi:zinc transporter